MTTQNQSIASNNTLLTQRKSPKAILCAIVLIVAGTALYLVSKLLPDNSSSLYMACVVGGMIVAFIGLLKLFVGGKESLYLPTKSPVRSYTLYIEALSGDEVARLLAERRFDDLRRARRKESGPVRIDIQRSKDDRFIGLQVMQFIPYSYEAVAEPFYFEGTEAAEVATAVGNPAK